MLVGVKLGHLFLSRSINSYYSRLFSICSSRLGSLLLTTFNTEFQTHLFAALPPTFPGAFKRLCESTIDAEKDPQLWYAFDILGLLDRYENHVASVCYERIEARTQETCVGRWREQVLPGMREWMRDTIVPWMTLPYARGARTRESFIFYIFRTNTDPFRS